MVVGWLVVGASSRVEGLVFLLVTLMTVAARTRTNKGMIFATSTPSTMMMNSRFELSCAMGAVGMQSFHIPSVGKFRILVKPGHSRHVRSVGKIAGGDVAFACVLVTATRKRCSVPNTAVATSKGRVISGSMGVGILPPSGAKGATSNGKATSSNGRDKASSSISGRSLLVATATGGAGMCRRRTFLLAFGVCAERSRLHFRGIGLPSFGKFRSRRVRVPTGTG